MNSFDKYIVSIDLGTSKIALTVATVEGNDVQIIYYKESPAAGIKYSGIYNVKQTSEALKTAIEDAEQELGIKITQAVIGMPKYPIKTKSAKQTIQDRGDGMEITSEDIEDLKNYALSEYPLNSPESEAIFGAVAQSFSDGENFQIIENDIIGMTSNVLEGHFKIFIGKQSDLKKIDQITNKVNIIPVQKFFTADTTAKAVLYDSEMENGVAMIDFGAGSTSVSIYQGNIMRHYASIPFGGKNITDDIKNEAQISETLAENIKLAYGACMPEKLQNLSEKVLHIKSSNSEGDKTLPVKYLSEIITARIEEIVMAIIYEIEQSGFADMLRSGLVITGGVAQTANLCSFIHDISGYKARIGYPRHIFSWNECEGLSDSSSATSIGLLLAAKNSADINCAIAPEWEEEEKQPETLTEANEEETEIETEDIPAEEVEETKRNLWGEDEEELERQRLERKEEERKKREAEKKAEEEKKAREEEAKKNHNKQKKSIGKRIWTLFDDLFNDMDDNNV
jgi:cell division protein FtsA